jgi:hypothetical protein
MSLCPDIDDFEERAAIAQYDGGLTRVLAELGGEETGFCGDRGLLGLVGRVRAG